MKAVRRGVLSFLLMCALALMAVPLAGAQEMPTADVTLTAATCPLDEDLLTTRLTEGMFIDCVDATAVFTFYPVGDGTADYKQYEITGNTLLFMPYGEYEVVEEISGLSTTLILDPEVGVGGVHMFFASGQEAPAEEGTLSLNAAECTDRSEPEFLNVSTEGMFIDCVDATATFDIYTAGTLGNGGDPVLTQTVTGYTEITLPVDDYILVEESTGLVLEVTVNSVEGDGPYAVIFFPAESEAAAPAPTAAPTQAPSGTTQVSTLPSTGVGTVDSGSLFLLAAGAAAALAGAGAKRMRKP